MDLRHALFLVLAIPMAMPVATADEANWPTNPASEVATFATILRYRIYADHCSGKIPQLEAEFDHLMEGLDRRIRGISTRLLSTSEFEGMKEEVVPVEIMDAIKHSYHDLEHNVGTLDAASTCSTTLRTFGELGDEALEASLTANLTAVHNMSQKMQEGRATR